VLKRAKASAEYRDDIIKRMPPGVVAEVLIERKDRMASAASASSSLGEKKIQETTTTSTTTIMEASSTVSSRSSAASPPPTSKIAIPTVTTPLLGNHPRTTSWGSNINHTVFKVTSYLGFANDRILLLQAYDDADDKLQMFEQSYEQEVSAFGILCFIGNVDINNTYLHYCDGKKPTTFYSLKLHTKSGLKGERVL
jgi:hypothetical protein